MVKPTFTAGEMSHSVSTATNNKTFGLKLPLHEFTGLTGT